MVSLINSRFVYSEDAAITNPDPKEIPLWWENATGDSRDKTPRLFIIQFPVYKRFLWFPDWVEQQELEEVDTFLFQVLNWRVRLGDVCEGSDF